MPKGNISGLLKQDFIQLGSSCCRPSNSVYPVQGSTLHLKKISQVLTRNSSHKVVKVHLLAVYFET